MAMMAQFELYTLDEIQTLSHNVVLLSSHLKSADHASYKDDLLS
jgi:hypothetical protein